MNMLRMLSFTVAAAVVCAASLSSAKADETIKIGVDAAYKPFAFVEANGELAGFEIDLIKAVCAEIKANCELSNVPWDGIFTALETGTIDMIGTTVTKTKIRLKKYDTSRLIYRVGFAFLVPKDADTSKGLDGLKGQSIGTIVGTQSYYDYIKGVLGAETDIKGYDTADAAVLDLDAGRIAAFQSDNLQLEQQYVGTGNYKLAAEATFDPKYVGEGRAWFFRKGSTDLVSKIDKGLDAVIAAGNVGQLGTKYFHTKLVTN
ncbi:transporter substrate-binding domain-containing protein [Sinorhizobium medicae]|uniref:substrate-binding periplasmic protein n=1 Tax=Sinorhizobium medicae TaxID=110321 RepID=UPI0012959AF4|nr:transporter substrate-binding domain-containing protein [Sinorhizobium medicae]MDX2388152.1 transporter substrate-binding domain-containing protein [Sinorhizobium medicae]MQU76911.1 transporter substrate-binding domain-containing protein [Sinorhizobium medicae]